MADALDLHEWVSFEDPDDDRTWMFDATFLMSNWRCIFGSGCQGVHLEATPELQEGCCSFGAHFIDDDDVAQFQAAVERLEPHHWQYRRDGRATGVIVIDVDGTRTTRVIDGACIFLNRPGFASGAGCSLHSAALESGERPLDWKPDVCWQLPLRLQEHTDDNGHVTSIVREWKRRDWGEGGQDFHWWCTQDPEAFVGREPTYRYLKDELIEMTSGPVYELLANQLRGRNRVRLPHPAVRPRPS